jgi:hypothetical protein
MSENEVAGFEPGNHIRFEGKEWTILNAAYFLAPTGPIDLKPAPDGGAILETSFKAVPYSPEHEALEPGDLVLYDKEEHVVMGAAYLILGGDLVIHERQGLKIEQRTVTHADLTAGNAEVCSTEEMRLAEVNLVN